MCKLENILAGVTGRWDIKEEKISDLENNNINYQKWNPEKKDNFSFFNEQSIIELWNNFKQINTHVIGIFEGEGGRKKIFEEIRVGNFLNLMKIIDPRSSMDLRYKKHEKNDTRTHHNWFAQNQW